MQETGRLSFHQTKSIRTKISRISGFSNPTNFLLTLSLTCRKISVHPILAQLLHVLGLIHHEHTGEVVLQVHGQVEGQHLGEIF